MSSVIFFSISVYKALYKSFGGFAADVVAAIDQVNSEHFIHFTLYDLSLTIKVKFALCLFLYQVFDYSWFWLNHDNFLKLVYFWSLSLRILSSKIYVSFHIDRLSATFQQKAAAT